MSCACAKHSLTLLALMTDFFGLLFKKHFEADLHCSHGGGRSRVVQEQPQAGAQRGA